MNRSNSINQKIDIETNKQVLNYYEYLRSITECQQSAYWIGNPSVEIISGKILLQPLNTFETDTEPENYQLYLEEMRKANTIASTHPAQENQNDKGQQQRRYRGQCNSPSHHKNNKKTQQSAQSSPSQLLPSVIRKQNESPPPKNRSNLQIVSKCLLLCGIPNSKPPIQVLFETNSIARNIHLITEIRVIKTVHIKYYGMLMLMRDEQSAIDFFNDCFGEEYSDLEMERIILRYIKQISLSFSELNAIGKNQMLLLRELKNDNEFVNPENIFMTYHHNKLKEKIRNQNQTQMNQLVCAICFEECVKQTISILCGHYFDFQCLRKWSENICPLCRYHQQPPIIKFCQKCNQCQGLWVCLICGERLCCGVNNDILGSDSHIYQHFKEEGHSLSMELETKFLFDAKIPAFLHQKFYKDLVQGNRNNESMKIEEKGPEKSKKGKIHEQIQDYENQVSEQMKSQREYFQAQISKNSKDHTQILNSKRQLIEKLKGENQFLHSQQVSLSLQIKQFEQILLKKEKQLTIVKNLIKLKQPKVEQKRNQFKDIQKLKLKKVQELDEQIKQKKEELQNYRKNLKLKFQLTEKLKNQTVEGQVLVGPNSKGAGKGKRKGK